MRTQKSKTEHDHFWHFTNNGNRINVEPLIKHINENYYGDLAELTEYYTRIAAKIMRNIDFQDPGNDDFLNIMIAAILDLINLFNEMNLNRERQY